MNRFKDRATAFADIGRRGHAQTTDQASGQIRQDVPEQVHREDDVEVLGLDHHLHRGGVDDHVGELDLRVLLGHLAPGVQEQSIGHLEDVRLVHQGDLLAPVLARVLEREPRDPLRAVARDDRDRLGRRAPGIDIVLDPCVQILGVLAHNHQIDVVEAGRHTGQGLGRAQIGEQVKVLPEGDVDRAKSAADRCRQRALERELIFFNRGQGALG